MADVSLIKNAVEEVVDTQRKLAGPQPGFRPVHAKGIVCTGTFTGTPEAKAITKAAHLQGQSVSVTVRFANASGNPQAKDGMPGNRSMSVKFSLIKVDGEEKYTDLLSNAIEGFPARTPQEFLQFLRVNLADPATGKPDPEAMPRFLESHPAAKAFIARLKQKPIPASYAQSAYHAVHAFGFTNAQGKTCFGRYTWAPVAGESYLKPEDGAARSADFLTTELSQRLAVGPVVFKLRLQIAQTGDVTDDATVLWPADREMVELGTLEITRMSPTSGEDEKKLIFDPTNLTDGIGVSEDPLVAARKAAYSISYERRTRGE